jgi:hypothetical protein
MTPQNILLRESTALQEICTKVHIAKAFVLLGSDGEILASVDATYDFTNVPAQYQLGIVQAPMNTEAMSAPNDI